MNANDREQLRLSLLRFLGDNVSRFGMSAALLLQMARAEGRANLTRGHVETELLYLEDAGLVVVLDKTISPENRAWRIHKKGRDYLAEKQSPDE